jgi:hypothetical protein
VKKPWHGQSSGPASASPISNLQQRFPKQNELPFGQEPGSFNDDQLVRDTISAAIKSCSLSREQIADGMTIMLGVRVTAKMLNNYTSEVMQPNRFPSAWDRAFCAAVSDNSLLTCRVLKAGLFVIGAEERDLMELGRQYLVRKRADEQAERIEKRLGGVDL